MVIFRDFTRMFNHPDQVLTERVEDGNWVQAVVPIILTILVLAIFPIRNHWGSPLQMILKLIFLPFIIGLTYLLSCLVFFIVGKLFKAQITYKQIFVTWGYSYYPTLGFVLFLVISHLLVPQGVPLFELGAFFSLLVVTFVISLFFWKLILYFVELKVVLGLNILQILMASLIIGTFFTLFWMLIGNIFGMKTPLV